MDAILESYIQDLAIDQLQHFLENEQVANAIEAFQKLYANVSALWEKQDEMDVTAVKMVTILTIAIVTKIADGHNPSEFDQEDWKEIADAVSQYAVLPDGQEYTIIVFSLYERYIRGSIDQIQDLVDEKTYAEIHHLADELCEQKEKLRNGEITEVQYTEECLWISLEAMIKLVASVAFLCREREIAEFTQALASCAFEYGRLMLYRQEQELVNQLLESQYQMDDELTKKYEEFKNRLLAETEEFYSLIDHAFSADFRSAFLQSILLAKAAGVAEEEILSSTEDIDEFFL